MAPLNLSINSRRGGGGSAGIGMMPSTNNNKKKKSSSRVVYSLLTHGLVALIAWYIGVVMGVMGKTATTSSSSSSNCPVCPEVASAQQQTAQGATTSNTTTTTFPPTLANMFVDYAVIPREDFNQQLEIGVPLDKTKPGAEDVLLLYPDAHSLPTSRKLLKRKKQPINSQTALTSQEAVENCHTVKVILQEPSPRTGGSCIAIMPQWESYHVHKFMRLPNIPHQTLPMDPKVPLRYVSRSHQDKGRFTPVPEVKDHTMPFYEVLVEYLQALPKLLETLDPILTKAVQGFQNPPPIVVQDWKEKLDNAKEKEKKQSSEPEEQRNTFIVQVCNYGQVELFHNFICNAKSKGFDTSHIIMFATDLKTYELCQTLGITAFYDETIFGAMPENAAKRYADRTFTKMMMAKVYCVHLVLSLGYNVLFQDVDVIWYQNPLKYFEQPETLQWDLMFQDDGARSARYAPYSPNTGFYFVRYNRETVYFFGMLLRSGDYISRVNSHQAALTSIINEHASWKGLRVKTLVHGPSNPFPGGYEYHRDKTTMKRLIEGQSRPDGEPYYIFHMSWTTNKDNKKLFFQQMGEWYTKADCMTGFECCLPQPEIICHYRDKPSKIPCKDAPPIDKGHGSWW